MADDETTTTPEPDYTDVPLVARYTPDGTQVRFYGVLNGVELPLVYLNVHDYREKFDEAKAAGEQQNSKKSTSK